MLSKLQKKLKESENNKGFTIIEVMIVLAIAGLIILIVFLAVPALQRSGRNTQRKSDVGRIGSAATTVISNLNGQAISATNFTSAILTTEAGNLGYYTTAGQVIVKATTGTYAVNDANVEVFANSACPTVVAPTATSIIVTAASHSVAIAYATETSSGASAACINE